MQRRGRTLRKVEKDSVKLYRRGASCCGGGRGGLCARNAARASSGNLCGDLFISGLKA